MWEALCPGRDQPPVSSSWPCCLGTKCLCSLQWRDLGANVCGVLLNQKNQYPAWGMAFAGIFFSFQMSEPENLCVCTHVLLSLVHCQPKKTISFSHKLCLSLCPGRHCSPKQQCKMGGFAFLHPPWCTCRGKNIYHLCHQSQGRPKSSQAGSS